MCVQSQYVRIIEENDIKTLVMYGEYFWTQSPYVSTGMEYNPSTVKRVIEDLRDEHYLRVYDHPDHGIIGFIGFYIHPMLWNDEYIFATEVFFFVHPDQAGSGRGRTMMNMAEEELKSMGVHLISMGEMRSSKDMASYYASEGYTLTEQTYSKVL